MKKFYFLIFLFIQLSCIYPAQAQSFKPIHLDSLMVPLRNGESSWADFNNDGWLDLVITGQDSSDVFTTHLYYSDSLAHLIKSEHVFPAVLSGDTAKMSLHVFDVNQDNQIDFCLMGKFEEGWGLKIFLNQLERGFTALNHTIVVKETDAVILGDFNNDGSTELILLGELTEEDSSTRAYTFRENTFEMVPSTGLPALKEAKLVAFDFNKDSKLDILAMGLQADSSAAPLTDIYLNQGNLKFKAMEADFTQLARGSLSVMDVDVDGFFDVVLTGFDKDSLLHSLIYQNKDTSFQAFNTLFTEASSLIPEKIITGDFDNDGLPDILVAGTDTIGHMPVNKIFYGAGADQEQRDSTLYSLSDQLISITDFDEDGSLDIFISGKDSSGAITSLLLHNACPVVNRPPSFPGGKFAAVDGDTVLLYWDHALDDHTKSASLTYNVIIWNRADNTRLVNGQVNEQKYAIRKVVAHGALSANNQFKFWGLPEGSYRWSVMTVDGSYKGSRYYDCVGDCGIGEGGCDLTFVISTKDTTFVCENQQVTLQAEVPEGEQVDWFAASGKKMGTGSTLRYAAKQSETLIARVKLGDGGDCYETYSYPVKVYPIPQIKLPARKVVCMNEEFELALDLEEVKYAWSSLNRGALGSESKILYKATQNDKIKVLVTTDKADCSNEAEIEIEVIPLEQISAGAPQETCPGEAVALGPGNEVREENYTFAWSPATALSSITAKNPVATPEETTWYYLSVINKSTGCESRDSVLITVRAKRVVDAGENRALCLGENTRLGGSPTAVGPDPVHTYRWFPTGSLNDSTSANPIATPQTTTTYRLIVSSANCLPDTAYVTVIVNIPPPSGLSFNYTIDAGESVVLKGSGGVVYKWTPATWLSQSDVAEPVASPLITTTYKVEVTDVNGCQGTTEHIVKVNNSIYVPNLFSPNSDGSNDTFKVYGHAIKNITFQVFTRSGQLLWETTSVGGATEVGWNGLANGVEQPNGTYIWTVKGEFLDGATIHYEGQNTGKFTLIR